MPNDHLPIVQYLRGYIAGAELYSPDRYEYAACHELRTPFQAGYWQGAFDYYCLLTGALPDEIPGG